MIDLIESLIKSGDMKRLIRAGLVSPKAILFRNVFREYDKRIRTGGKKTQVVSDVAEDFDISERYVYLAIKAMSQS